MKRQRLIHSTWEEFSHRFITRQGLPLGTALHLYDRNGRKKRSDWQVKRRNVGSAPRSRGSETVNSLLLAATDLLSTDIKARRLKMRLASSQGDLVPGNTLVKTVRALPRRQSENELAAAKQRKLEIEHFREETRALAAWNLRDAEHLIEEPENVVPFAYLGALCDRYGRDIIKESLDTV